MLSLASLITAAVLAAGAVSPAPTETRIAYGDLDLSTRAGATEFDARVRRTAQTLCKGRLTVVRLTCVNQVRNEALSLLPERARTEYARGRVAFEA